MGKKLLTAAVVAVLLAGCSKGDDKEETKVRFTIDMEQISILAGDDHKITPSGAFTARSSNEDVATVNSTGVIHGVSAGDADVIFTPTDGGQTQTCKVSVDWRYKYFDEPILDFDLGMEQVKAKETHRLLSETSDRLTYSYDNQEIPMKVAYDFAFVRSSGFFVSSSWTPADGALEKIRMQLSERFPEFMLETYFRFKPAGVSARIEGNTIIWGPAI